MLTSPDHNEETSSSTEPQIKSDFKKFIAKDDSGEETETLTRGPITLYTANRGEASEWDDPLPTSQLFVVINGIPLFEKFTYNKKLTKEATHLISHILINNEGLMQRVSYVAPLPNLGEQKEKKSDSGSLDIFFEDPKDESRKGARYNSLNGDLVHVFPLVKRNLKIRKSEEFTNILEYSGKKIAEHLVFPEHIDINKWLPLFLNPSDETLTDPHLPFLKWFSDLGIIYRSKQS